jgi:hypothetical protein
MRTSALIVLAACGAGPAARPDGGDPAPDAASADAAIDAAPSPDAPPALVSCTGQTDAVIPLTTPVYVGTTATAAADTASSCGHLLAPRAPDREFQLDLPDTLTFSAHVTPDFLVESGIRVGRCDGPVGYGSCDGNTPPDHAGWGLNNTPAGRYFIVVHTSAISASDQFSLVVSGVIQPNGRCDLPLFVSGALTCAPGTACNGTACVGDGGSECSDGIDNDGDGKNGYPFDPGCESLTDPSELDDCPGGLACPPCATPADEDGDGYAGFPTDPGCRSPGDPDESDDCLSDPGLLCPVCANGSDDDFDGDVDFGGDPACSSAAWNSEYPEF